jgi:hypothetical protein
MNWGLFLKYAFQALTLVPQVVIGIEQIKGGAKQGASKKELAMKSLGLANGVSSAILPEHQAAIDAATALASTAIDNTVALLNAIQHPDFVQKDANVQAAVEASDKFIAEHPTVPIVEVPAVVTESNEPGPLTGPGLHNIVSA